jgi:plasmid rolling circle replication initiator protein Rep
MERYAMRHFIVSYNSQNNVFKGHLHVKANTISEAQDKFLDWLRQQPTYTHLWHLSFGFEEVGGSL